MARVAPPASKASRKRLAAAGTPRRRPASAAAIKRTGAVLAALSGQHPGAFTELDFRTPFELLVATILSAQSTDCRVNLVTPALFARYPDADTLVGRDARGARATNQGDGLLSDEGESDPRDGPCARRESRWSSTRRHGRVDGAARCRPEDGECRARSRARGARTAGGPARTAGGQSPRDRAGCHTRRSGGPTLRFGPPRGVDTGLRHAHPARPSHLPAATPVRSMRRAAVVSICGGLDEGP